MFCSTPPRWHYCVGSLGAGAIATLFIYGQWLWAAGLMTLLALLFSRILNHPCYSLYKIRIDNVSNNAVDRAMRGGLVVLFVFPVVNVFSLWDFHPAITFLVCTALAPFLISNITASSRKGKDLITQHGRNADPAAMENLPSLTHAEAKIVELLTAVGATDGSRAQLGSLARVSGIPMEDLTPAAHQLIDARILTVFTGLSPADPEGWYVELTPIGCALAVRDQTANAA
ncbi:hypothetical protein A4R63_07925 [Corynebacterium pseudotuberculosis]|uniref:hypothetical protein n=1 Tax=Corynebacterium pseudotuberculosis TaxID=1719 RepID=UPI00065E4A48|nr:hypothetical protein [Corynebacterium pseudotuberculosis]AKN59719.2 hypothetical protein CP31_08315 [Corynebacterium pseudotuberculosis 31]APB11407.1 hypothetical protein A4R72_08160 [Corynebacterium pseudotuberculosis]APB13451.1 hypothetical protein A4R71_08175 [Corynebacterium pseudotuberculosis]APB15494.1 hypothetical protein A4R68_08175 [Corynebacterium pseudotuberculosis]APB17540.1 hypothetical protein A4R67_08150 [Corynebacterium pseudotuberculosis]